jgi:Phage integrase, N-terminal SAM-like domain
MTPLRAKMIRELELYRKSPSTIEAYVSAVAQLASYYHRSPDRISVEEIRDFLHHLITQGDCRNRSAAARSAGCSTGLPSDASGCC